jgi:hypothetical protein
MLQLSIFSTALYAITCASGETALEKPDPVVLLHDLKLAAFVSPGVFAGPVAIVQIALPTHRPVVVQRVGYQIRTTSSAKSVRLDSPASLSSSFWTTPLVLSLKRDLVEVR